MARIREALRQVDARERSASKATADTQSGSERALTPRPYQPCQTDPEVEESGEEVAFIEVGGRNTPVEGSPSVLTSGNSLGSRPLIIEKDQTESQARRVLAGDRVPAAETRITGVVFAPFPAGVSSLRPISERFAPGLVALHKPNDPLSEQYRCVVKCLGTQLPAGQSQVLLFTGSSPRLDTTTVLLNLAIIRVVQSEARIVVVDANLYRSAVADRLGLPQSPGLCEVLGGSVSLQRAIQETGQANLKALTTGKVSDGIDGLLASEAMRAVLRHLRGRYDWVLVDAPCWTGRPEVVALGASCDTVYLVLPKEEATSPESERLRELIPLQGGRLRGSILVQH
jgi:Mrp family chromosome partitioning ATPase